MTTHAAQVTDHPLACSATTRDAPSNMKQNMKLTFKKSNSIPRQTKNASRGTNGASRLRPSPKEGEPIHHLVT
jgi:hypothetical protein